MTEQERQKRLLADYKDVFESEAGQRVLADIMRLGGLFDTIETNDQMEVGKMVGRQNLAKEIAVLNGCGLEKFIETLRSGNDERREHGNGIEQRESGFNSTDHWNY
ncbi:MAG: hypothetical protein DHS20C08_04600 [Rhodomicrobium sp.]|nr:MAG: hypothetical protein DHS20C08_04600 [Rhodomicrobium sp.]